PPLTRPARVGVFRYRPRKGRCRAGWQRPLRGLAPPRAALHAGGAPSPRAGRSIRLALGYHPARSARGRRSPTRPAGSGVTGRWGALSEDAHLLLGREIHPVALLDTPG